MNIYYPVYLISKCEARAVISKELYVNCTFLTYTVNYSKMLIFVGTIISSVSIKELSIIKGFLAVENGKITQKGTIQDFRQLQPSDLTKYKVINLKDDQFLMPGLIDCHTHAPQFPNIGLGLDRPLLDWLAKYTFPLEKKYEDIEFAARVYDRVVKKLLTNGTTTACYFGTLHLEGTLELVNSVISNGQRALVGKVSMNEHNDEGYYNDTQKELREVEMFVSKVLDYENDLIQPVVTPRFAVSCDEPLMTGLSNIANKYNCLIQSHISENLKEVEYVLMKNPKCKSYSDVYDKSNILNNKCIMAHAVHLSDEEMRLLSANGVSVAHCPASNTRLKSGLCPVVKLIDNGITVGLGTDVAGGDNASILDAMRRAMDVSCYVNSDRDITWSDAFYLATLGGAKALGLDHKIGSFEIGKDFDALLIDVYSKDSQISHHVEFPEVKPDQAEYAENLLQRFIYTGDDRNIVQVYVQGKLVKDISNL